MQWNLKKKTNKLNVLFGQQSLKMIKKKNTQPSNSYVLSKLRFGLTRARNKKKIIIVCQWNSPIPETRQLDKLQTMSNRTGKSIICRIDGAVHLCYVLKAGVHLFCVLDFY